MKILIVRHAEPDYAIDGLTEKGKKEAQFLAERLEKENIKAVYCSVFGRARLTAEPTLKRINKCAEYCEWLREFEYADVKLPYEDGKGYCWDIQPYYMDTLPEIYSPYTWMNTDFVKNSKMYFHYQNVVNEFDKLLLKHGYRREGYNYRVENSNHDVIVLFCHFGVEAVLLSHLMNCSPYTIWQHACCLPSSVTTIYTEERVQGIASFRATQIGDLSHLYAKGEENSFFARWCECFNDKERH